MTDSARTLPPGSNHLHNEEFLVGYRPLAEFLTSEGFPISRSSLQKLGMPSADGAGPPREGFWGNLPVFRRSKALEWARSRIRPTRGTPHLHADVMAKRKRKDSSAQPDFGDSSSKGRTRTPPSPSPDPSPQRTQQSASDLTSI